MADSGHDYWLWAATTFAALGTVLIAVAGGFDATRAHYAFWSGAPMIVAYVFFALALCCVACGVRGVPFPGLSGRRSPAITAAPDSQQDPEVTEGGRDKLFPGERLSAGEFLCSQDGTVKCDMQREGNLVVRYGTRTLWDSITAQTGNANYLEFCYDGNLLLRTGEDEVLIDWRATGMGGKLLVMQDDGNLDLYADHGRTVWATDRLKDGTIVIPVRPDLRAHPKRRVVGPDDHVTWI